MPSTNAHACSDRDSDVPAYIDTYIKRDGHGYSHCNTNGDSILNGNTYSYCYGYGDSYPNSYRYIYSFCDTATDSCAAAATNAEGAAKSRAARKLKDLDSLKRLRPLAQQKISVHSRAPVAL